MRRRDEGPSIRPVRPRPSTTRDGSRRGRAGGAAVLSGARRVHRAVLRRTYVAGIDLVDRWSTCTSWAVGDPWPGPLVHAEPAQRAVGGTPRRVGHGRRQPVCTVVGVAVRSHGLDRRRAGLGRGTGMSIAAAMECPQSCPRLRERGSLTGRVIRTGRDLRPWLPASLEPTL